MKLGVLKVIADKIPALLYVVCGSRDARCGPKDDTLAAANERISHMGRLILATLAPPGYVCGGTLSDPRSLFFHMRGGNGGCPHSARTPSTTAAVSMSTRRTGHLSAAF